jgi:uncharacterized repeat protein (TIGR04042 family)
MPEMSFRLRWPDASETLNYSPSSVIRNHFRAGETYAVPEFLERARAAMEAASARVQDKYGFPCARARATFAAIEQHSAAFAEEPAAAVTIVEFVL